MRRPKRRRDGRADGGAGLFDGLIVDNFAGGGGASIGIELALGRAVDVAINHDREAVAMHTVNHPHTRHYCENVWKVDPLEVTGGRPVSLAWFSPDCKHFSRAKGGKPVSKKIRGLAWVVIRWAKRVKPRVIMLENVREFETWGPTIPLVVDGVKVLERDGTEKLIPCPLRKGQVFKRWVSTLRNLGYEVAWRTLDAADFGAPTHRKRLFLVARCDGEPIRWPGPTHGPGRSNPYRTAAECIDWSLPCPSIFLTKEEGKKVGAKRPLEEKTMRRIAMGIRKFVLENPKPFIVQLNHGGHDNRSRSAEDPSNTITAQKNLALVTPFFAAHYGEAPHQETRGQLADEPLRTITPRVGGGFSVVAPHVTKFFGGVVGVEATEPLPTVTAVDHNGIVTAHLTSQYGKSTGQPADQPAPTQTAIRHTGVIAANLVQYNGLKGDEARGNALDQPMNTITAEPRFALGAAFLNQVGHRDADKPGPDVAGPLNTILSKEHHILVVANLVRIGQTGGNGSYTNAADTPLTTIVSKAEHCIAAANLIKMNYGDKQWYPAEEPLRTILGGANHHGLVASFLTKYYGTAVGQDLLTPLDTVTARHRFGLVTIRGQEYRIADIGLRMLKPVELYRCQGFPESYLIDPVVNGRRLPISAQVRMCGNSVSPPAAEALVRANFAAECAPARKPEKRRKVAAVAS